MFGAEVKLPAMWGGTSGSEARDRYHACVIDKYSEDQAARASLVTRLEGKVREAQLLLAAIKKWERSDKNGGAKL